MEKPVPRGRGGHGRRSQGAPFRWAIAACRGRSKGSLEASRLQSPSSDPVTCLVSSLAGRGDASFVIHGSRWGHWGSEKAF